MKKPIPAKKPKEVEAEPDAWERFENAVHKIAPPKKAKAKETPDKQ